MDSEDWVFTGMRARNLQSCPWQWDQCLFIEGRKCKDLGGGRHECFN